MKPAQWRGVCVKGGVKRSKLMSGNEANSMEGE